MICPECNEDTYTYQGSDDNGNDYENECGCTECGFAGDWSDALDHESDDVPF